MTEELSGGSKIVLTELCVQFDEVCCGIRDADTAGKQAAFDAAAAFVLNARVSETCAPNHRKALEQMRKSIVSWSHLNSAAGVELPPEILKVDPRLRVPPRHPRRPQHSMLTSACGGFITPYIDCSRDYEKEYEDVRDLFVGQGD